MVVTNEITLIKKSNLVTIEESRRFMIDCFIACNASKENAIEQAELLVGADYCGHFSHGMNRLDMYLNELIVGTTNGMAKPIILKENDGTAWVDGCNGLGAVIGNWCMDLAMKKASKCGIGMVSCKRTNHNGMAGWYTERAEKMGFIGLSMTNTSPVMAPTRSRQSAMGTNPIAFSAPSSDGKSFLLDMATTTTALGKIELKRRKGEKIPIGWAQDTTGKPTTDPQIAWESNCLMPLGGSGSNEESSNSSHKGFGLAAMVEILCGVLSGGNFATQVRKWTLDGGDCPANLGQTFIAIDPNCFAPEFNERVTEHNRILRNLEPVDPTKPVLVAGDPERTNKMNTDKKGGILYHENQIDTCNKLAIKLNVKPLSFLNDS